MKPAVDGSGVSLRIMVFLFFTLGMSVFVVIEYDHFRNGTVTKVVNNILYDTSIKKGPAAAVSNDIVIVDIDEESLLQIGQWPWPRYRLGRLLQKIGDMEPAAVGLDIIFPEPDRMALSSIKASYRRDFGINIGFTGIPENFVDSDEFLGDVIRSTPTVPSHYMLFDYSSSETACSIKPVMVKGALDSLSPYQAPGMLCNFSRLNNNQTVSGFINTLDDEDGILRRMPMVIEHRQNLYPNLALAVVMQALDIPAIQVRDGPLGTELQLASHVVPLAEDGTALLWYPGPAKEYSYISAADLLKNRVQNDVVRGKIVFIGSSAAGLYDFHHTIHDPNYPGVEALAVAAGNILQDIFIREPAWGSKLSAILSFVIVLLVIFLFVYVNKPLQAVLGVSVLLFLQVAGGVLVFHSAKIYIPLGSPLLITSVLFALFSAIRYGIEQRTSFLWYQKLTRSQQVTLETMATVVETRDYETGGHIKRTQHFVRIIAEQLSKQGLHGDILTPQYIQLLFISAPLHDIGKVGVPDKILLKPGPLTNDEFEEMKKHTLYGRNILLQSGNRLEGDNFLEIACEIAESHHEKWDGTGYPLGLAGEKIPLSGRIMMLADVYDALTSKRCYKPAYTHEEARTILLEGKGTFFDPDVIEAFFTQEEEIKTICRKIQDHEI